MESPLRIYADFNSTTEDGWCWCLWYQDRNLDELGEELNLRDGMSVLLFYEDPSEEFEFDGTLSSFPDPASGATRWMAKPIRGTYRLLRDSSNE
jgi:hypothetical protein